MKIDCNMKGTLRRVAAASALALGLGTLTAATSQASQAGELKSIIGSCRTFRLEQNDENQLLFVAQCDTLAFDTAVRAELNLDENVGPLNGWLSFDGANISQQCQNIRLDASVPDSTTLIAECVNDKGVLRRSALDLSQNVFNDDGALIEF